MATILIYSNNNKLIEKCINALTPEHSIDRIHSLNVNCSADVIIVDTERVDHQHELLKLIANHPSHILLAGSQWAEEKQVNAILHAASGYCDEAEADNLLPKAINSILQGDIWMQRHLVPKLIETLINRKQSIPSKRLQNVTSDLLNSLSHREWDVANRIRAGENNKQIAGALNISERTVKAHLTSIFKKLHVTDRLHLAILLKESS
ncbi:response regulator transcription factor [Methylomarinum sp. Ch1-1]|uniref:Response regulator transcription factor n=1 Tax=Methylomarinum roseum TaxID=3067653 RepID=A0AAU7NUT3_9GAMM|nr:response regulator transcription factor [Methylomarinum sp. Ch1-1]MDP4519206.1 response regulator transcription factor [Methylomarinum sp. Ch1-1]